MKKVCQICGVQFQAKTSKAKYCSSKCKGRASYLNQQEHQVICQYCGKSFKTRNRNKVKYCSVSCGLKATTSSIQKQLTCQVCGKHFMFKGRTRKKRCQQCSRKQSVKATMLSKKKRFPQTKIGVGSGRAQNTNTPRNQHKLLVRRLNYQESKNRQIGTAKYRNLVITGSDKCQLCGFSEYQEALVVHHKDMDRTNNSLQNLTILCSNCHMHVHKLIRDSEAVTGQDIVKIFQSLQAEVKERNKAGRGETLIRTEG